MFALCQLLLLQKGAGVCSVCTVPAVVVTEGCGSVQCLHCANCCCYRRVRECAVFALYKLLLLQKGAGVCSVCTVPTVVVTEGCGSVQCLHCANCCCYRRVRECAVFALCQLLLLQKGAGVCSVCTVPAAVGHQHGHAAGGAEGDRQLLPRQHREVRLLTAGGRTQQVHEESAQV